MDEKEFLNNNGENIELDEKNNLSNNLKKIDSLIDEQEKKKKLYESYCDDYKGEYQFFNEYRKYNNKKNETEKRINELNELVESPYFAHMYLEEQEHDEDMFIGYEGIADKDGNQIVYDWRSKVGNLANSNKKSLNYNGFNYTVKYKRNVEIKNRQLTNCIEKYNSDSKDKTGITDYYLRSILRSKQNEKGFSDIVRTIQENQNDIIRADINTNIMCQGVAGSGKTAIIVHRLSYLLYNNPKVPAEKYLFIAPNDNFKKELSELNKKLSIDKIKLNTLYDFYIDKFNYYLNFNNDSNFKLEIKNIIDDENVDIKEVYSEKHLLSKYKIIEDSIYEEIKPIIKKNNLKIDKNQLVKDNIQLIRKILEDKINDYSNNKNLLNKNSKSILDICKKIGQITIEDETSDNKEKIKKYNKLVDNKVENLLNEIAQCKKIIKNIKNKYDISFYESNDYSIKKMKEHVSSIMEEKDNLENETNKMQKSIFRFFQRETIQNNLNKIEEYENIISEQLDLIKKFKDNEEEIFMTKELISKIEINKKSINILTLSTEIGDYMFEAIEAYKVLRLTLDISPDAPISFTHSLKMVLNYILEKPESIEEDDISKLVDLLKNNINIKKRLNTDQYFDDKKELDILINSVKPKIIIKRCFDLVLKNRYSLNSESLKKQKFYRNDVFTLLYIFNKLEFRKQNLYNYLYIDEAQDYNDSEIKLIKEIEANPIMNIFGDYKQNISLNSIERKNWDLLINTFEEKFKYFELNENYRNTINIVDYCNKNIKSKMYGIGLEGKDVKVITETSYDELIKITKETKSIIITNDNNLLKKISIESKGINISTVLNVKGLEFENIIVIDKNMDDNNKYVAYTRAKKELIIINDIK